MEFYKNNYEDLLYFSDSIRTTDKVDLFKSNTFNHRYKLGYGNLVDMLILSKTDYLFFSSSNIPSCAMFFSKKKIPHAIIDNGIQGNIFFSQFSWYIKKNLPEFLGGFKNEINEKKI